ncbi:MAG: c-type cytochrome [Hyphomicrobium sp.]|nr:c-type cytochrome [Hyphomicrobium sp.]
MLLFAVLAGILLAGYESRAADDKPASKQPTNPEPQVSLVPLAPGGGEPIAQTSAEGRKAENDPAAIEKGKALFSAMNCVGCHANGGGGMGPPLMDKIWIYGGSIENIAASIREGRPNGMPSFRGFLPDEQVWEVAAFVRSLSVPVAGSPSDTEPAK